MVRINSNYFYPVLSPLVGAAYQVRSKVERLAQVLFSHIAAFKQTHLTPRVIRFASLSLGLAALTCLFVPISTTHRISFLLVIIICMVALRRYASGQAIKANEKLNAFKSHSENWPQLSQELENQRHLRVELWDIIALRLGQAAEKLRSFQQQAIQLRDELTNARNRKSDWRELQEISKNLLDCMINCTEFRKRCDNFLKNVNALQQNYPESDFEANNYPVVKKEFHTKEEILTAKSSIKEHHARVMKKSLACLAEGYRILNFDNAAS